MSGSSKSSTPARDLARLTLGSRTDMAVQTRSQRKRTEPPSSSSSRGGAPGSSRGQPTRPSQQQRHRQQPPGPPGGGNGDDGDDSDNDLESSSSDDEEPIYPGRSATAIAVNETLSAYHPNSLLPDEYYRDRTTTNTTNSCYRALGDRIIAESNRNPAFLPTVESTVQRRTAPWAHMIADRQLQRLAGLLFEHNLHLHNTAEPQDVPRTVQALTELDNSIDLFLRLYQRDIGIEGQKPFVEVLVHMLNAVVGLNTGPINPNRAHPVLLGGGERPRNVYNDLIGHAPPNARPIFVLRCLAGIHLEALATCQGRICDVRKELDARHHTSTPGGGRVLNNDAPAAYMNELVRIERYIDNFVRTTHSDQ